MTSDILKRATEATALMTKGRPVQFHPNYCPEAKGAQLNEWDSSHDLSVIFDDGSRYRIGTFRHADDAHFDQLARTLIPDMAAAIAERDVENERLRETAKALLEAMDGEVEEVFAGELRNEILALRAALGEKP